MRPLELRLKGFRSFYDETTISFEPGAYYLLGRNLDEPTKSPSNGAGKTGMINSFGWANYGVCHNGAKKDQVIHWDAEEALVEVTYDNGLRIRRSKKKRQAENLSYFWQGEWKSFDLDETQARVTELLGISPRLFFNGVWISKESNTVQFLRARPAQRLEILEEIVNDARLPKARTVAERRRKKLEEEILVLRTRHEEIVRQEGEQKLALQRAQSQYQEASQRVSAQQQRKATQAEELRERIRRLTEEIGGDQPESSALRESLARAEARLTQLQVETGRLASQAGIDVRLACPTCQRPYDTASVSAVQAKKREAEALLRELSSQISEARAVRDREQGLLQRALTASREQQEKARQISDLRKQLQGLDEEGLDTALLAFQSHIETARGNILKAQREAEKLVQEMHEKHQDVPRWKMLETAFGAKGIRTLMLDEIRLRLAHYTPFFVRQLSAEQQYIEYPRSSSGFEILLHGPKGVMELDDASTGEFGKANLAVLLALRQTLNQQLDMLFLDDATGNLDEGGEASVVDVAEKLAQTIGLVFVTVPRRFPAIPEDSILTVEKRAGCSRILLEV